MIGESMGWPAAFVTVAGIIAGCWLIWLLLFKDGGA